MFNKLNLDQETLGAREKPHTPVAYLRPVSATAPVPSYPRIHSVYMTAFKRVLDLGFVIISAPVTLLLLLVLIVLIRRDGGPAFYAQDRVGKGGTLFKCYKLRSMVEGADEVLEAHLAKNPADRVEWNTYQKLRNDPRITPVGRFIRKSSIDEIPQLWNVFKGEMSIVGPRPFLPEQRHMYQGDAYYQMKPGLTGIWQVSDHNDTAFEERSGYDNLYGQTVSLWTDIKIMLKTVLVMLRARGL